MWRRQREFNNVWRGSNPHTTANEECKNIKQLEADSPSPEPFCTRFPDELDNIWQPATEFPDFKRQEVFDEMKEESELTKSIAKEYNKLFQGHQVTISVPQTHVALVIEKSFDEDVLCLQKRNGEQIKVPDLDHLFKSNLLKSWFVEFTNNEDAVLEIRSSDAPNTLITKSFVPNNFFQWNAFCGRLACNVHSGNITTEKSDSFALPLLVLDHKSLLLDSCKKQFQDFLRKEITPFL